MMLLIAMAITVAFVASGLTSLGVGGVDLDFWWELALLVVIMLLGHWLEMRALGQASSALDALAALLPDQADRVDPTASIEPVASTTLRRGRRRARAVRAPGSRPTAIVTDGEADVDESMITGESRPVPRSRATGSWPGPSPPTRRSGCGSTPSARPPRWPASSGWSNRPRPPGRGRRRWPTGQRRCCSTSPRSPG